MAGMPLKSAPAALAVTVEADAGVANSAATGACELVVLWPGCLLLFFSFLPKSTCFPLLRLPAAKFCE